MDDARGRSGAEHRARWGPPRLMARAPGRVNLIGEHTDYNDGFTMPMALPFDTVIALSDNGSHHDVVTVVSEGFGEVTLRRGQDASDAPSWAVHLAGVVQLLDVGGVVAHGWRAAIATDIPAGASLSSSAALEVAAITALLARADTSWPPIEIARLGQRVENEVVGLPSGIMDQFISAGAQAGHVSLMDCRALTLEPVALPEHLTVAVMDTGTRRVLADAAYADRRAACERAADDLGVAALRDASFDTLSAVVDPGDRRRARHVVTENARVVAAAEAMRADDGSELGRLMSESHASLRDDFEVSAPALDAIVAIATGAPGCLGARLTGGGFAGCAVALVDTARAAQFADHVVARYRHDGHAARVWLCEPAAGAGIIAS